MTTVAELIALLQGFPSDLPVYRDDHEWGAVTVRGIVREVAPPPHPFTLETRLPGVIIK